MVCCSVDCPLPSKTQPFHACTYGEQEHCVPCELEQVIVDGKLYSDQLVLDESNVRFLNVASESVLTEAKRLGMLSESTYRNILLLQREETKRFKSKTELLSDSNSKHGFKSVNTLQSEPLQLGDACYFMSRYLVKWKLNEGIDGSAFSEKANYDLDLGGESWQCHCRSCIAEVRHMVESDWLYLAKLSKCASTLDKFQQQGVLSTDRVEQIPEKISRCLEYASLSAQRALFSLKSIPVAARGGLPVLVNPQGLLLSIPVSGPFSVF